MAWISDKNLATVGIILILSAVAGVYSLSSGATTTEAGQFVAMVGGITAGVTIGFRRSYESDED